eukprot:737865-Karenia_brevis.AAC.1
MKKAILLRKQATGTDWSFSRRRKQVRLQSCNLKNSSGQSVEIDEWPGLVSDHMKGLFQTDDKEKQFVETWLKDTYSACVDSGHFLGQDRLEAGEKPSDVEMLPDSNTKDCDGKVLLCFFDGSVDSGLKRQCLHGGEMKRKRRRLEDSHFEGSDSDSAYTFDTKSSNGGYAVSYTHLTLPTICSV